MKEYKTYIAALGGDSMATYCIHRNQNVIEFLELELKAKTEAYEKQYLLFYWIVIDLPMCLN